jgi:hypothetical protein
LRSEDVPDIELAALAIEHGLVLASHDSGFRRFAGLRSLEPLAQTRVGEGRQTTLVLIQHERCLARTQL